MRYGPSVLEAITALAVLAERPALRRPATLRALGELISHERARQDARLSSMRRLRGEAESLFAADEAKTPAAGETAPVGLRARLAAALRRAPPKRSSEAALRARYEEAQVRARRAVVFAESLGHLEGELAGELLRLNDVLRDLAHDANALEELRTRVRTVAGELESTLSTLSLSSDAVRTREIEGALDHARARAEALAVEGASVRDAEDRLLGLLEGERMLAVRLAHLRAEVECAAQDASKRLDDVADALRALVTAEDAQLVIAELEGALARLTGSLDNSARLAKDTRDALAPERRQRP